MMANGIDTPYSTLGLATRLKGAGFDFVMRYCSPNSSVFPNKRITAPECAALHAAGLSVGLIYESMDTIAEFENPDAHAGRMLEAATGIGAPTDLSICLYAAVDFDASDGDLSSAIIPYFTAIHSALKCAGYLTGVYGSGHVIRKLKNLGIVHAGWLAQSTGWSEYDVPNAEIVQGKTMTVFGLDVDHNVCPDMVAAGLMSPTIAD